MQVDEQTVDDYHQVEQEEPMIVEPMIETEAGQKVSSYASLVDQNEGSSLKYEPPMSINGVNCAKLQEKDVVEEIRYWNSAVLCYVLGEATIRKGFYIVRFHEIVDTDSVQLPELNIKYRGIDSLRKIGSLVGLPIKTDKKTRERSMLSYARLLVEMDLKGAFPKNVDFVNKKGLVRYEWKLVKCSHCGLFGHEVNECRKKNYVRQEWRMLSRQPKEQHVTKQTPTKE
ncbi:hypothetical protein Cgig2_013586 [Carnegiea gigantea]|uniref:CCHC-type domain-containing protein n=1 Tax=Carnegiea gigantea TaxID=171969 RepID=A0A9Q1KBM3_9CARY|nr:hypothetical protein Cgig2_013586 [Carnegiea gigantea]